MAEENLLETVPETAFIAPAEETEIPETIGGKLFTTPNPVDLESEGSGNNTPEDSDGLVKLIDEELADDMGKSNGASEKGAEDNSKIAEFSALPIIEKGAGGDDDESDRRRTIEGSDNDDLIVATGEQDKIFGKKGKDTIKGNRGKKNKIYGGKDDDDCEGGDDDDEIRGDRGNDKVNGGKGNDTVNGGKDNDSLFGGTGNDTCEGDDGNDWVHGNEGDDDVDGGAGSDSVYGGKGNDDCKGGEGNDTVRGDTGNDTVNGGDGNDTVNGGKDNDTVIGGAGSDACMGDDGDDSVMGGTGDDTVMGGAGNDTLVTGDGNDMADGGGGDDSVSGGGGGDDTLMGGDGNDTLMGGTGNHTCVGGAGNDVYVLSNSTSGASSVITDFEDGKDKFLLFGDLNFSSLTFIQVGGNTEIRVNNFALALLLNVNATLIDAGDFLGVTGSTPTPTPTPTANPVFNPPRVATNNSLTAGSSGSEQTITSGLLSFVDTQQGPSGIIYKLTELPAATTGQLFFKGAAVTQVGFTFTQADINAGLLTFKAAPGFIGAASFGFEVSNGRNFVADQRFSLNVERNVFNFAGNTAPQTIVGSATLDNDIEGGDGDDDITAGLGKDKIIGGKGKDKIKGGEGDNDIDGGDDDDDIEVGKGKNKIIGGKGNDTIKGGDGDDSIEGGEGTNSLIGGAGKDRFIYRTSREQIQTVAEADFITDFNVADDVLEFSNAAFSLSASSLTRRVITASSTVGAIGSANLLDFSEDTTVNSIATLQARFAQLGVNSEAPVFCQFIDATTGRSVLVFAVGTRFDIVASFSGSIRLQVSNFVFTGPPLNIPVGTADADNLDFTTSPAPVNYDGLAGDDKIVGSNYNDNLKGGDGNDTITGGLGFDVLSGGTGADLFVYKTTKEGGDKITDFKSGTDKFEFSASAFGNLTTTNFDGVSGVSPDITGKELVIFTGGSYASLEDAQAKALGNSTTAGFFAFTNASNETVLYFDSNGTLAGGSTLIANLGTATTNLGTADFVFTGTIASGDSGTPTNSTSVTVDFTAPGNTFPTASNNFGSGGYNFTSPVLFTGDASANSVTGTEFADIFSGGSGADIFDGGLGNDSISGDDGNDSLFGGGGSDTLNGGPGNDTLIGGGGTNVLSGGSGLDVFVFSGTTAGGGDLITNYNVAEDVINLDKTGFAAFTTGGPLGSSFYAYSSTVSVTALEATLTGPSIMAIYDSLSVSTKLYYDSNGSNVGGSSLFATVDVNLGISGNSELFLF